LLDLFHGPEQQTLAGPRDMGEEPVLDGIVFGVVGWLVGHADLHSEPIRQLLQAVFQKCVTPRFPALIQVIRQGCAAFAEVRMCLN
jgi:hypothetical protein